VWEKESKNIPEGIYIIRMNACYKLKYNFFILFVEMCSYTCLAVKDPSIHNLHSKAKKASMEKKGQCYNTLPL